MMGISSLRRKLCAHAKGSVLEVAAGTGRNMEYYPSKVQLLVPLPRSL